METPDSSLREQGLQALRTGNLDSAIDLLARAVIADSQDAEAQALLGVAYCQKGLHAQATRALQTAVTLRPQEARFHYNLGVALEQAGDRQRAAAALREALQINPQHAQAREKLRALTAAAHTPAAPPQVGSETAAQGEPWLRGSGTVAAPQAGPPGTVRCPQCHQWSKPGLSCEWCSTPLKSTTGSRASAPWLQSSYSSPAASAAENIGYSTAPEMSAGEAFGRRFAASFIDGLVCYALSFVGGLIIGIFFGVATGVGGGVGGGSQGASPTMLIAQFLGAGVGMLIGFAYYVGMLCAFGQTLGKMALGIRVVGPDGGKPVFWRAAVREIIGKLISAFLFCLGYLWMLWDSEQQTWHDKLAGTHVERA
jgi:uncharacterized RDD family membrane protein YckC